MTPSSYNPDERHRGRLCVVYYLPVLYHLCCTYSSSKLAAVSLVLAGIPALPTGWSYSGCMFEGYEETVRLLGSLL